LLDGDDEVVDVNRIETGATVLSITEGGMGKRTPEEQYPVQGRGGKGVIAMAITEKTGPLACMKICRGDEDVLMIRDDGTVIRVPVEQISIISRNTQGVRLMRVDDETRLAGVALLPREESFSEEKDSDK
jgi:DNA gyrase subunit A